MSRSKGRAEHGQTHACAGSTSVSCKVHARIWADYCTHMCVMGCPGSVWPAVVQIMWLRDTARRQAQPALLVRTLRTSANRGNAGSRAVTGRRRESASSASEPGPCSPPPRPEPPVREAASTTPVRLQHRQARCKLQSQGMYDYEVPLGGSVRTHSRPAGIGDAVAKLGPLAGPGQCTEPK